MNGHEEPARNALHLPGRKSSKGQEIKIIHRDEQADHSAHMPEKHRKPTSSYVTGSQLESVSQPINVPFIWWSIPQSPSISSRCDSTLSKSDSLWIYLQKNNRIPVQPTKLDICVNCIVIHFKKLDYLVSLGNAQLFPRIK